jgi:type IV pilus assembly protein PilQ
MSRLKQISVSLTGAIAIVILLLPQLSMGASLKGNSIYNITTKSQGSQTLIKIHGSKPATFSAYRLHSPPRVVLEIAGSTVKGSMKPIAVDSWAVTQVAVKNSRKNFSTKIVISLARRGGYQVVSKGKTVFITVTSIQPYPENVKKAAIELRKIKTQAAMMQKRLNAARKAAKSAEARATNANRSLKTTENQRTNLNRYMTNSRREVNTLEREKREILKKLTFAKKHALNAKKAEKAALKRFRKMEKRTASLNKKRIANLKKLKSISINLKKLANYQYSLSSKIKNSKSKIAKLRQLISKKSRLGEKVSLKLKRRLWRLKSEISKTNSKITSTKGSILSYRKIKTNIEKKKQAEEAKLSTLKKSIRVEKNRLIGEITNLKSTFSSLKKQKGNLQKDLIILQKRKTSLSRFYENEKRLTKEVKIARRRSDLYRKKIRQLLKLEIIKAKSASKNRHAVENLLNVEKRNLSRLKKTKLNELKALAKLSSMRKRHNRLLKREKKRLRQLRNSGDYAQAKILKRKQIQRKKELKKLVSSARKWEKKSQASKLRLNHLTGKLKRAKRSLSSARTSYSNIQLELAEISQAKDRARSQLRKTRSSLESISLKAKSEKIKLHRITKKASKKRKYLKKVAYRLRSVEKNLSSLSRKKSLKESELKSLASMASSLTEEVNRKKDLIQDLEKKRVFLATQLKSLKKAKNSMVRKNARIITKKRIFLQKELKTLTYTKDQLKKEISLMESKHQRLSTIAKSVSNDKHSVKIHEVQFVDSPWSHQVVFRYKGKKLQTKTFHKKDTLTLTIPGAILRHDLCRKMDATAYNGPIRKFLTWNRASSGKSETVLKVYTRGFRRVEVRKSPGKILVLIPKSIAEIRKQRKNSRVVTPTRVAGYLTSVKKAAAYLPVAPKAKGYKRYRISKKRRSRRYRGRFVDLDFKDANIHNVIRLVAEVWGRNVVIPDDVKGSVSIKLTNVRVDRAFDVILKTKGLSWNYEGGNIIRVITMDQAKKEREDRLAMTKTKVRLIKTETRLIPINYASAEEMAKAIKSNVKSSRGKVTFDKRTNVIIYVDIPSKLKVAQKLIRSLDLPTPQVQIEARIVEAESTFLREIGIQWGGSLLANSATGNPTGLIFPSNIGVAGGNGDMLTNSTGVASAGAANPDFAVNLPAATGSGAGGALGMTLGSLAGAVNINLRLSAMEEIGHVRSISAPKITTLDNIEAKISQGVEIPYPQSSAQGNTVIMKQAVLSLAVTPHVTNDNMVQLKIKVTKDEPDETHKGADGSLGIAKKAAETVLLVKSGDTAVIGGIYKRQSTLVYRKIPWFADIPIIGWLFKNQYKKDVRSELLIFITPRVLNRSGITSK